MGTRTTPGTGKEKTKDRRKGEDSDHRRGRSRERRSEKEDRHREPKKSKKEKKNRGRSRSRSRKPAVLSKASAAACPADKSAKDENSDHGPAKGVSHVSLETESSESEKPADDDDVIDGDSDTDEDKDKSGEEPPPEAPHEPQAEVEPQATAREPPVESVVKAPPDEENGFKSGSRQRLDKAAPRGVHLQPARPGSTEHGPRAHGPENESGGEADSKHGKYTCTVCGRQVGGGVAGDFQHRRSQFHLASWVWHNQPSENARTWKQCQKDGERWSATLWKEGKTGPAELSKKAAKQSRPPVVRSDPGRNKRDGPGPDNGPGSGPPGAGPGAASSGSGGDLLLKMWQATVRELK